MHGNGGENALPYYIIYREEWDEMGRDGKGWDKMGRVIDFLYADYFYLRFSYLQFTIHLLFGDLVISLPMTDGQWPMVKRKEEKGQKTEKRKALLKRYSYTP